MTNAEILVCAWRDALNARDVARMLSLTSARIEVITPRGTEQGPACVREFIERQTYGVGLHLEQPRVFADGDTVVLAARRAALGRQRRAGRRVSDMAAVFVAREQKIARVEPHDDLGSALAAAGLGTCERRNADDGQVKQGENHA
jgi:ketosteroid isomerase-like protein